MSFNINIIKFYLVFFSLILSLDISSNFILPAFTSLFAALRDLGTLAIFVFIVRESKLRRDALFALLIVMPALYFFYGIMYPAYFLRFIIYFIVFKYLIEKKYSLAPLYGIPVFLMLAFFFVPNQSISQGFRFFSGNATVVGIFLLALALAAPANILRHFSVVAIFLTGSLAAIASFLVNILTNPKYAILVFAIFLAIPLLIPEGETSRRLAGLSSFLSGNVDALSQILTLSARINQFSYALADTDFNFYTGLPPSTYVGAAGIESQLLHFIAFGGWGGVLTILVCGLLFLKFAKIRITVRLAVILFLVLLTIRAFESVGIVVALVIILNARLARHQKTGTRSSRLHTIKSSRRLIYNA